MSSMSELVAPSHYFSNIILKFCFRIHSDSTFCPCNLAASVSAVPQPHKAISRLILNQQSSKAATPTVTNALNTSMYLCDIQFLKVQYWPDLSFCWLNYSYQ